MARSSQSSSVAQVEEIKRQVVDAPAGYHLRTQILVHARRRSDGVCPCCDSPFAEIVQTIADYDRAVIVPGVLRHTAIADGNLRPGLGLDDVNWVAGNLHDTKIVLRCTEEQFPLLTDNTARIVFAFGGQGSGKTMVGLSFFARQWVKRGGRKALFWLISSELGGTYFLLQRLLIGDTGDDGRWIDPILPLRQGDSHSHLATRIPKSAQQPDRKTYMVDGSEWDLKHAAYRAGSLKRVSIQAAMVDEVCEVRNQESWGEIVGRTRESRGPVFGSTTPVIGHWVREVVMERKDTKKIHHAHMSMKDNCWLSPDEYAEQVELAADDATAKRLLDGEWISTGPKVWIHWNRDTMTLSGAGRDCSDYTIEWKGERRRLIPINPQVGPAVFTDHEGPWRYMLGQDFNQWPCMTIVAQLCVPEGEDWGNQSAWHMFVMDEVWTGSSTKPSDILRHCEFLVEKAHLYRDEKPGLYAKLPVSCDASGAYHSDDYDDKTHKQIDVMREAGFTARPCRRAWPSGKPRNPGKLSQVSMIHALMKDGRLLVHAERCPKLVESFEAQEATDRGLPKKVPGALSDRLSAGPDATIYLAWPFFGVTHDDLKDPLD